MVDKDSYWRIASLSDDVFKCPLDEQSCLGGAATGESSCSEGYSGPLCDVCEEGTILYDTRHAEI
jgi:hypothetical protein